MLPYLKTVIISFVCFSLILFSPWFISVPIALIIVLEIIKRSYSEFTANSRYQVGLADSLRLNGSAKKMGMKTTEEAKNDTSMAMSKAINRKTIDNHI